MLEDKKIDTTAKRDFARRSKDILLAKAKRNCSQKQRDIAHRSKDIWPKKRSRDIAK